ncbi:hypothetical protein UFOVP1193_50 [uncultured Caudovirales phage]|uniref:Uncharacterized protein n=1 Tax=uncultured Caudovirales phage TaxID=2100421 RepID=A0A6J5R9E5_9CAUD|nr:hypothetical protein UFOVP1193_50 [uncultured Caudovirales phage]
MALPNPKPFSMQSPDALIELSGGNKQKLLQMVQAGSIDQTSALLAAMKIDKIRSAAQLEQAPQQTVMQKAFAPPAPPAGLGATPQGMQMAGGPAPQGAPPMQMASAPPPMGMPQMAGGGLTTLPVPDAMFDEHTFANGGIVAFKDGATGKKRKKTLDDAIARLALIPEADPYAASASINMTPYNEHGPLYPAKEFLRDNIGLSPETRSLRDGPNNSAVDTDQMSSFAFPQNADDSIYSPSGGGGSGSSLLGDPSKFRDTIGHMSDPIPSYSDLASQDSNTSRFRAPQNADDSIYSPGTGSLSSALSNMFSRKEKPSAGKPYAQKLLDAAAEFERKASNDDLPQAKKDYYYSQARNLRENAQQQEHITQENKETIKKYYEPVWSARARAVNQSVPTLSVSDQLKAFPGYEYFGMNKRDIAERDSRVAPVIDKIKTIDANIAAARSPTTAPFAPSAPSYGRDITKVNLGNSSYGLEGYKPDSALAGPSLVPPKGIAALAAAPRPRVPGTLTTKPKADADTTAPAAKTPTIQDLQKKFDETGKLPDFKKLSAEERAAQKNEDLWSTVLDFSARLLSGKNQNALTNAGEAAAGAMPGMQAALKERRADEKDERKQEFDYLVKAQGVKGDNLKAAYSVFNNMADREQRETLEDMRIKAQASEGRFNRENQLAAAGISANALPPDVRTLEYLKMHPEAEALYNRVEAAKNPLGLLRAQSDITTAEAAIDRTYQHALDAARRNATAQPNNPAYAQAYTKLQLEAEQKKAAARARIMGAASSFGPTGSNSAMDPLVAKYLHQ